MNPNPRKPSKQRSSLPIQLTTFIGRQRELNEISALLEDQFTHLLTLSGPGGVGKTRLALQAAALVQDQFKDGVFFVDLAPLQDPNLVINRIAHELGVKESLTHALLNDIIDHLSTKHSLLLLDNFEQILEAASTVSELIANVPSLKVLVTSREALHLYGEQEYPVLPLSLPERRADISHDRFSEYEAVDLFIQRAQASNPNFRLSEINARHVAELCIHLDGLPLAIELAAARVKIFSPEYMLDLLSNSLGMLTAGPRDFEARHQTLRAAIDWSYNLLDEDEKTLFARLGIFQGGHSLEAIEIVCGHALESGVLHCLESLLNKSLIIQKVGPKGEPRFVMLETIQQYARERLKQSGEVEQMHRRHAEYFAELAKQSEPLLRGPKQEYWSARLRADYDNLLAALEWSFTQADASIGLRLAASLSEFWYYEGSISQSRKWIEVALKRVDQAPPEIHAKMLNGASMLAFVFGQHERGKQLNQEALAIARQSGDRYNQACALLWLSAHATKNPNEYLESVQFSEQAVALFEELGDQAGLAWGYNQIGESTRLVGDFNRAGRAYEASLAVCRQTGNRRREAISLVNLSYVAQRQGEYEKAENYVIKGLELLHSLDLRYHCAIALAMLSGPVASQGKAWRAAKLLGASQAIFERMSTGLQPADQVEIDGYAAAAAKQLDPQDYQAAWAEGQRLSFEQAMMYAPQKDLDAKRGTASMSNALTVKIMGEKLSARELEVLCQLASGLSIEEIAAKLYISPSTLRSHTKNIYRKLDVHRRAEAVQRGKELGLL